MNAKYYLPLLLFIFLIFSCQKDYKPGIEEFEGAGLKNTATALLAEDSVKVLVFNIRYAWGTDGVVNLDRVVNVIQQSGASIVALNEIDRFYSSRSGYIDQVAYIANALQMNYAFQGTTVLPPDAGSGGNLRECGHALLTKYRIAEAEKRMFSQGDDYNRGILRTRLDVNGTSLEAFVTHWGLDSVSRHTQFKETVLFMEEHCGKNLLMGDLNELPAGHNIMGLKSRSVDAMPDNIFTFPTWNPAKKLDYIFASRSIDISNGQIINTNASDHLPVVATIDLNKTADNSLLYTNFPESFETRSGTNISGSYSGNSGTWSLEHGAIVVNPFYIFDDRPSSGVNGVRLQQNLSAPSYLQMNFNVPNGASKVTVWYSSYFKDA
ncbi:MAG TPA: endonuclease/exonuclease/phosphatase family protein, partial [Niabella sp.]|nr:endonuclease/exonuclease/phosphatase family protein [Niabella sp.]